VSKLFFFIGHLTATFGVKKTFKKTYLTLDFEEKDKYNSIMLRTYVIHLG